MRVLLSWLRELVDVPGSAEDIARTMSLRGFAVEGIEPVPADVSGAGGPADAVLDFEVTGNRPDCMSIVGMAREIAVAYGVPLKPAGQPPAAPKRKAGLADSRTQGGRPAGKKGGAAGIDIVIESPDLCPRYVGAVAEVEMGASPAWMQRRLEASGIRPISNIVDITNYVLLETGQPMHAFDLARLAGGQIRVRAARPGETLRTLDGQTRTLPPEALVIADAERAVAVAGVMGGGDSEVTAATRTIVFESAYFNPLSVRRTSKRLGLKTEASMRFERGADPSLPPAAMARALVLIETTGAGRPRGRVIDRYPARIRPATLRLRRASLAGLLGCPIPDRDVRRILERLGFTLGKAADGWRVVVPTRRGDVTREVDLIEEVARHYGFDRLPVTFPALAAAPPPVDPRITRARQLRRVLTAAGFFEAVTFGFTSEAAAAPFAPAADLVPIANPLSESFAVLRPSVLPGLIDAVAHNRRREQRDVRLFEIGARFTRSGGERRAVACAWTGTAAPEHWSGSARAVDFFDIKAVVERVCGAVGVAVQTATSADSSLAAGSRADLIADGTRVGVVGRLAQAVADAHGLPDDDPVYVGEIDLDALEQLAAGRTIRVAPLPRYPSVTRDLSVLVADTLTAADILRTVRDSAPATLVRVNEFDRYQGKGIPDGSVSLSLRLTFRSSDRTLTDAEVQAATDRVVAALKERHGAVQR
ncbi:MAG: phenylalanine--tRNA ligase subunit beta [Acidobacteria bacterium]|nr:phenylalanine--tRNA ligase subunit beta [Acidobacteriota bacterium]